MAAAAAAAPAGARQHCPVYLFPEGTCRTAEVGELGAGALACIR